MQTDRLGKLDPLRPAHKGIAEARQEDDDRLEGGVADGLLLHSRPSTCSQKSFLYSQAAQQCAMTEQPWTHSTE